MEPQRREQTLLFSFANSEPLVAAPPYVQCQQVPADQTARQVLHCSPTLPDMMCGSKSNGNVCRSMVACDAGTNEASQSVDLLHPCLLNEVHVIGSGSSGTNCQESGLHPSEDFAY